MKKRLQTLLKLGITISLIMYLVDKAIESSATIHNLLNKNCGKYYRWTYGSIYYNKTGSGSPILLIHDLNPSSSSQEWSRILDDLAKKHTVYTIDLLGCGRSDKPNITYVNYLYTKLLLDFIKNIIAEKADIIATGASASFAVMAASIDSSQIGNITMVNPIDINKLYRIPDQKDKLLKKILDFPILGTTVYYLLTSKNQIEYEFSEKYYFNPFHLDSKLIHMYYESAHLKDGSGRYLLSSINAHYLSCNISHALKKIENHISIILGNEMEYAQTIANQYAKIDSSIQCTFIEKTKMLPQLEAPENFLENI